MQELTPGLWRWTTRHPQFHPAGFEEVASFAARAGDGTLLLIDPLLPPRPDEVLAVLDDAAQGATVAILITIPYHVRSAPELAARYGATVHGHARLRRRLPHGTAFAEAGPHIALPGGAGAHVIGRPRRMELPLYLPSHDALVFGDAVVEHGGALRIWSQEPVDAARERFYRERFVPTLKPLLDLAAERVLVTHGRSVLREGTAAFASALRARPWHHGD